MKQYLELLSLIRTKGKIRPSRGVLKDGTHPNTQGVFGAQMRFDLNEGFPLVTTKKMSTHGFVTELLWFMRGSTNIEYLNKHNVHIWDAWADYRGELGPVYGAQWRCWERPDGSVVDQLVELIEGIKKDPFGRRHILSAWNVGELHLMALPPCHMLCQFYVDADMRLSCQLYQRSADMFLGVPWNIASYALLTHCVARLTDLEVGEFIHTIGDAHIYENHFEQVDEQRTREPLPLCRFLPADEQYGELKPSDFTFEGYTHHPALRGEVAV